MPLQQDLAEFCIDLKVAPGKFCVTLPGGSEICVQADYNVPDPTDAARKLFEQANSAMTPLVPVFNIIDAVVTIVKCFEDIPKALGGDISAIRRIGNCIPELGKKVDAVIALLPQTSIPILAAQILDSLIAFVKGYKRRIEIMKSRLDSLIRAKTRATELGNTDLEELLDCAEGNLNIQLANLNSQFEPLSRMIGLVNALLDLAGLPCIPALTGVNVLGDTEIAALDEVIALLEQIRSLIPIPDIDPDKPAKFSKTCDTQLQ